MNGAFERPSGARWAGRLNGFILEKKAEFRLPSPKELTPLIEQQHRVSQCCLEQFVLFTRSLKGNTVPHELHHALPSDRLLVILTDTPGGLAAAEIIKRDNLFAIWLTERLWGRWQSNKANRDPTYRYHFRYWSYWNQSIKPGWSIPPEVSGELWVHTEGHLLAQLTGHWAQHLWSWDKEVLTLVTEAIEHG